MDYEKKYKDALERLRAFHNDYDNISNLVDVKQELESIFPELRESEDERIRKILSTIFANSGTRYILESEQEQVLSWLEKQKKQKPVEWSEEDEKRYVSIRTALEVSAILEKEEYDANVDWLRKFVNSVKYRKPLSQWKPSEEQMNRLCAVVDAAIRKHNESVSGYEPARVLKSLYEDLKKLM